MFFNKTDIYNVYIKESAEEPLESAIFIPESVNIWAGIFSFFWFASKFMLVHALLFFILFIVLSVADYKNLLSTDIIVAFKVLIFFYLAFNADNWYAQKLISKGYILYDVVSADGIRDANKRFFEAYL